MEEKNTTMGTTETMEDYREALGILSQNPVRGRYRDGQLSM